MDQPIQELQLARAADEGNMRHDGVMPVVAQMVRTTVVVRPAAVVSLVGMSAGVRVTVVSGMAG